MQMKVSWTPIDEVSVRGGTWLAVPHCDWSLKLTTDQSQLSCNWIVSDLMTNDHAKRELLRKLKKIQCNLMHSNIQVLSTIRFYQVLSNLLFLGFLNYYLLTLICLVNLNLFIHLMQNASFIIQLQISCSLSLYI